MDPRVEIFLSPLTTHDGFYLSVSVVLSGIGCVWITGTNGLNAILCIFHVIKIQPLYQICYQILIIYYNFKKCVTFVIFEVQRMLILSTRVGFLSLFATTSKA